MTSPNRPSWAAARRRVLAAGIALLVLVAVAVALIVTRPSSAAEPTPVQRTTTVEDQCTGIGRDKPC